MANTYSLSDILSSTSSFNAEVDASKAKETQYYTDANTAGDAIVSAMQSKGQADALVDTTKQLGEMKAQQVSAKAAVIFGTDLDASSEILSALENTKKQEYAAAQQTLKVIGDKKSIDLLSDPVGWIEANLTVEGDEARYEQHTKAYELADRRGKDAIAMTTAEAQAIQATKQTLTGASIEASANSIKLAATAEAEKQKATNMFNAAKGLEAVRAASYQQLQAASSAHAAVDADKSLQLHAASVALQKSEFAERVKMDKVVLEERQQRIDDRKATDKDIAEQAQALKTGLVQMGYSSDKLAALGDSKSVLNTFGKVPELYSAALKTFLTNSLRAPGTETMAETPGDAAVLMGKLGTKLPATASKAENLLRSTYSQAVQGDLNPVDDKGIKKDVKLNQPGVLQGLITTSVTDTLKQQYKVIKPGDKTNLYAAPAVPALLAITPQLKDTPLYKDVLAPLLAANKQDFDPDMILSLTANKIKDGGNLNSYAKDIALLANKAAGYNNSAGGLNKISAPLQNQYNAQLNSLDGKVVNIMNEDAVKQALVKITRGNHVGDMSHGFTY